MSFAITLYQNNSENNKIGKSLVQVASYNGNLRETCDILNPVINFDDAGLGAKIATVNYMYIPAFGRYYFINKIESISNNIWRIYGNVDVLETYKDAILNQTAVIARQENEWNLYLNDGTFKVYQNPIICTINFPNGFTDQEYILAVAGG